MFLSSVISVPISVPPEAKQWCHCLHHMYGHHPHCHICMGTIIVKCIITHVANLANEISTCAITRFFLLLLADHLSSALSGFWKDVTITFILKLLPYL